MSISLLNDGNPEDIQSLDNPRFKFLYRVYFQDLTGGMIYKKPVEHDIVNVDPKEAQVDLKYLISKAEEWDAVITKTYHSEKLLQHSTKEARQDIKVLNSLPQFRVPFIKGSFYYRYKKWGILLRSKYIYHLNQEILETKPSIETELDFCSHKIVLNEYGYTHIVCRHFAQITTEFDTGNTYHSEDFMPRQLNLELQSILTSISTVIKTEPEVDNIVFDFKLKLYSIWTAEKSEGIAGKGMVTYRRIETFYPVQDQSEKDKINQSRERIEINQEIGYWKKITVPNN